MSEKLAASGPPGVSGGMKWPKNLTAIERLETARAKMGAVVDQVTSLMELDEANRVIVYSPTLAGQIPRSRAAFAFNVFQHSSFGYQLVRTCALWDPAKANRISIPTIAALVDHPDVHKLIAMRVAADWPDDYAFGQQKIAQFMRGLNRALPLVHAISGSDRLLSLVNHRNKHLAHALSETYAEMGGAVLAAPKYGFERKLLKVSISLADRLYLAISNTSFAWDGSRQMARRNALALWNSCRFEIEAEPRLPA